MPALQFILTTAGKNAIINANNTGTNPITINRVAIGSASWTPTVSATALNTEIKKITAIGGGVVADDTIHVTATDATSDVYTVREVGLYTTDNVLLAIYSQADPIITKGAGTVALIAADLVITGIPADSVTVGDTTFDYPQATETVKGVAELATTAEAQAGTDDERIITPKKLQDVTATTTRKGVIAVADADEVIAGLDPDKAVTPGRLAGLTATVTRRGLIEIADSDEVLAGIESDKAVTPSRLAALTATTARRGLIEIATLGEVQVGVDTERAVTPATLNYMLGTSIPGQATTTALGLVELATNAEVQTGTDAVRAVTPASLNACTATTSRTGVIELATDAEVQAGTDSVRAVTPSSLNACTATATRSGVVELATDAEVQTGTDATRAVTPASLNACTATTTRSGVIEIATQTETAEGTDTTRAVVPQNLRLHPGVSRAWVNFDGTGTVAINASHNVTSVTDLGVGLYQINWDVDFGSTNYAWVGTARQSTDGTTEQAVVTALASGTKTAGALRIRTTFDDGGVQDCPEISIVTFA